MSNQVFEIVQAMSGQGNCITIPGPYLDFFAGDRQQHLLAAILNQLVFWSGKSSLDDGWLYKEHAALAKEAIFAGRYPGRYPPGERYTEETLSHRPGRTDAQDFPVNTGFGTNAES